MLLHGGKLSLPEDVNFAKYMLDHMRKAKPDRVCLQNCTTGDQLQYSQCINFIVRLRTALAQRGVGLGETVAVAGEPNVKFLPTWLAVVLTGATYTPIELDYGAAVITQRLNLTKPKYVICTRSFWEMYNDTLKTLDFIETFICFETIEDLESVEDMVLKQDDLVLKQDEHRFEEAAVKDDDVAMVVYSSGTTDMPKGVLLTHRNCIARLDTLLKLSLPQDVNFAKYMLDHMRKAKPDRVCLQNCTTGDKLKYSQCISFIARLRAALAQRGVGLGETVAVAGERNVKFLPTWLAVVLTGATYMPIELDYGAAVLTQRLNLKKPKYVICTRSFWEMYNDTLKTLDFIETFICFETIEDLQSVEDMVFKQDDLVLKQDEHTFDEAAVKGDDVAMVLYSSGSTDMPKGVLLTHSNCIVRLDTLLYPEFESLQTVYFSSGDPLSPYGQFGICTFIAAGKTVLYSESDANIKIIQDFKIDAIPATPSFVEDMVYAENKLHVSSLKIVYVSGARVLPSTAKAFRERYPHTKLIIRYGATEVGVIATTQNAIVFGEDFETSAAEIGSVGTAAPGVTIKVVDVDTRELLGPHQRGEICVKSQRTMKGYTGPVSAHLDDMGFYPTGDLGYYDERQLFYLVDRLKDFIVIGTRKICPGEVEVELLKHEAVRKAAVVGKPTGGVEGDQITAFVVLRPGAAISQEELVDYVAPQVPPYMQLRGGVRLVTELPRNKRGKILRRQLRDLLALE